MADPSSTEPTAIPPVDQFADPSAVPSAASFAEPAAEPGRGQRARLAFRQWRRTRPFWGALWMAWGGFVILYLPLAPIGMILHVGIGGITGMAGGVILMAMALLVLVMPGQRYVAGIVAVVVGVASFPLTNLGGFFVGMFSAILGGVMAFGWMPAKPDRRRRGLRRLPADRSPV